MELFFNPVPCTLYPIPTTLPIPSAACCCLCHLLLLLCLSCCFHVLLLFSSPQLSYLSDHPQLRPLSRAMLSRLAHVPRRLYSAGRVSLAEAAAAASESAMTLNLVTPHQPIHHLKKVDKVMLPGEDGEYGVTAGHSPLISQLQPGVVTIVHLGVSQGSAVTPTHSTLREQSRSCSCREASR